MKKLIAFLFFLGCGLSAEVLSAQVNLFLQRADSSKNAGSPGLAIEYYLRALAENEKEPQLNRGHVFYIFRRLGNCYLDLNNSALARNYFFKASKESEYYTGNINEALLYSELAQFYFRTGVADSFLFFTSKVEGLAKQLRNDSLAYTASQAMAIYLMQKKDFKKAKEQFNYSLSLARQPNLVKQLPEVFNNLGSFYFEQEKFKEALTFFDSSYYYANRFNDKQNLWYGLFNLAETWYALGNYQEAYKWKLRYSELNAQIMSTDNNNRVAEMQARYDLGEKESDLAKSKTANLVLKEAAEDKEKQLFFVLAICALALLAIGSVVFFYRRLLKKNNLLRQQQQEEIENTNVVNELNRKIAYFSSQVSPEIFFRSISRLKEGCDHNQIPANSLSVINELAGLMRTSLNLSTKDRVPLSEEIALLQKYISLEKMNDLVPANAKIQFDDAVEFDEVETPSILLQPLFQFLIGTRRLDFDSGVIAKFRIEKETSHTFLVCNVRCRVEKSDFVATDNFELLRSFTVARERVDAELRKCGSSYKAVEDLGSEIIIRIAVHEMF